MDETGIFLLKWSRMPKKTMHENEKREQNKKRSNNNSGRNDEILRNA
jgi:hypothetical protein